MEPWTDTLACHKFGPTGIQRGGGELAEFFRQLLVGGGGNPVFAWLMSKVVSILPKPKQSEDCLTLNIWSSDINPEKPKPVMVWIHGGGYLDGSSREPLWTSPALAKNGVVYVSINYRLGIFGFLAHPELSAESGHDASGNYGMMDQIAALQWVQDNIAAFGGDPDKVTIFGESGGGDAVIRLTTSPLAQGLFHRAIAQSPATYQELGYLRHPCTHFDAAERNGEKIAAECGISGPNQLQRLRALSTEILQSKVDNLQDKNIIFNPIVDGHVFPKNIFETYRDGDQSKVPLLLGSNSDEGILLHRMRPVLLAELSHKGEVPPHQVADEIRNKFGADDADILFQLYPGLREGEALAAGRFVGDHLYGTKTYFFSECCAKQNSQPVYLYHFSRVPPSPKQTIGAAHAAEIPFVHGSSSFIFPTDERDEVLSQAMIDYWTNFALNGDPNDDSNQQWPEFTNDNPQWLILNHKIYSEPVSKREHYQTMARSHYRVIDDINAAINRTTINA